MNHQTLHGLLTSYRAAAKSEREKRKFVKTDKDSGIVNDANLWATETMGNAKYPVELFQRVITVSLETMKIVRSLPNLVVRKAA